MQLVECSYENQHHQQQNSQVSSSLLTVALCVCTIPRYDADKESKHRNADDKKEGADKII